MSRVRTLLEVFGLEPATKADSSSSVGAPSFYSGTRGEYPFTGEEPDQAVRSYDKLARRFTVSDLNFMCGSRLGDMAGASELLLFPPDAELDPVTGRPDIEDALGKEDHPFYTLLDKPNPVTTKFEWLKQVALTTLLSNTGSFVHIDDGKRKKASPLSLPTLESVSRVEIGIKGEPVALWTLLPNTIEVKDSDEKLIDHFLMTPGGGKAKVKFDPKSIMWLREFNPTNFMQGLSRMVPAQLATDFDMAAKTANVALFKNGLRPGPIVEADREFLDPTEFAMIQHMWEEQLQGVDNWHKILPLWGGFKLSAMQGFTPAEADYIRGSEQATVRIFGVWGVHPGIVFVDNVNLANAQVGEYVTRKFTLEPLMTRISTAISSYILPLYSDVPDAVAHFVNVVPRDEQTLASIDAQRSAIAQRSAQATQLWVQTLGKEEGLEEAKRLGVVSEDVTGDGIPEPQEQQGMGAFGEPQPGQPSEGSGEARNLLMAGSTNGSGAGTDGAQATQAEPTEPVEGKIADILQAIASQQLVTAKLLVEGAQSRDFEAMEQADFQIQITPEDLEELEEFWDKHFPEYAGLLDAVPKE